jgi:hypothetical protein
MHGIQHDGERKRECHACLDFVAVSIPLETFTAHTAVTLTEEEMAVGLPPSAHLSSLYTIVRLLITDALATILSLIGLMPNGYLFACSQRPFPAWCGSSPHIYGTRPHFSHL